MATVVRLLLQRRFGQTFIVDMPGAHRHVFLIHGFGPIASLDALPRD